MTWLEDSVIVEDAGMEQGRLVSLISSTTLGSTPSPATIGENMADNKMVSKESKWLGRSLTNYKSMHAATARAKGVGHEFEAAKTLTQARKIAFGYKKGNTK